MKRVLCVAALLAVAAASASAQVIERQFSVTTRLGAMAPERSASLDAAGLVGVDTEYALNRWFGLGVSVDVARGNTRREDFLTRLRVGNAGGGGGDTIYYQYISQPVNTINLGAFGLLRYPGARVSPFLMGGVGGYTLLLDTQVAGRAGRKSDLSYTVGGGLWIRLTERSGLQFDVRSMTLQGYDRAFLDPSQGKGPNTVFPEDFPTIPAAKNTAQNIMFTLGFRYIPGASGSN
jgi:opacity protein-like surface antigen